MKYINFTKMQATGNDFVIIDNTNHKLQITNRKLPELATRICDRKFGIGADGLLVLEKSKIADVRMRIFNADGSEAEMCGNGASCVALWAGSKVAIETKAGIIESEVNKNNVKIKLTDPKDIKLDIPVKINPVRDFALPCSKKGISNGVNNRNLKVNFIDTGVPHAVIFVEGLEKIDVVGIGRLVRYHQKFSPRGTNVNFVEALDRDSIKIRTYERGVEDETLACGTGAVASSLMAALKTNTKNKIIKVHTKGKEILKVYFDKLNSGFKNIWLEGKASIVFEGTIGI